MHAIKSDWNTQGHTHRDEKQTNKKKQVLPPFPYKSSHLLCTSILYVSVCFFFLTHRDEPLKPPTALQNRKPVSPSQRVSCGLHQDLSKVTIERDRQSGKKKITCETLLLDMVIFRFNNVTNKSWTWLWRNWSLIMLQYQPCRLTVFLNCSTIDTLTVICSCPSTLHKK